VVERGSPQSERLKKYSWVMRFRDNNDRPGERERKRESYDSRRVQYVDHQISLESTGFGEDAES
jgi:hypothetical protein